MAISSLAALRRPDRWWPTRPRRPCGREDDLSEADAVAWFDGVRSIRCSASPHGLGARLGKRLAAVDARGRGDMEPRGLSECRAPRGAFELHGPGGGVGRSETLQSACGERQPSFVPPVVWQPANNGARRRQSVRDPTLDPFGTVPATERKRRATWRPVCGKATRPSRTLRSEM
jgi:hypothetical protein